MNRCIILTGFVSILLVACTVTTPAPSATFIPTAAIKLTSIPTLVPTATLVNVALTVKDKLINCRFGPGVQYELINELDQGETARVVGRNEASSWWYIRDPGNPDGTCWVSASVSKVQGDTDNLPVIAPPAIVA